MTDKQLAAKAADLIEERGLAKNVLGDAWGRVCVHGALNLASHGSTEYSSYTPPATRFPDPDASTWRCGLLVARHIGISEGIVAWNNAPERTAQEVIDALRSFAGVRAPVTHGAHEGELVA